MKLHDFRAIKLFLLLIAAASAALPGTAPVLTANPSAVTFQYGTAQPLPQPVFISVTASNGTVPVISVSITPGTGTPATLFPQPPVNGTTFQVGVDINTMNTLLAQPGTYTATATVTAPGFSPLSVPVTLGINTQLSVIASPSTLSFNPPTGPTVQTISLTGPSVTFATSVSTASGGEWLSVTTSSTFTPATLTVTVNPQTLATGSYSGTITITPSVGSALTVPVTLQVGSNTLGATPSSFSFNFTLGGTTPPAQVLQLTSTISNNTYVAQSASTGNWLLVNGLTSNVSGTLPASVNVTVNPGALTAGTYQGTITVTDAHNSTVTINATLVVNGVALIANPPSLAFLAEENGAAPAKRIIAVSQFANASFTATSNQPWLSVSPASGPTPDQVDVMVNPAGLAPGTYKGNVQIDVSQHVQNVPVTFVVSATPVLTTDIGELVYSYLGGNPSPPPQNINVTVSSGSAQQFTIAPGVPSWLQVTSVVTTTPAAVTIALLPQGLPNGTYLADVIITPTAQGGLPVTVPVLLTVSGATPVVSSASSLTFSANAGTVAPSQTIQVTASTPTPFTATATTLSGSDWLTVTPGTGTASVNRTTLTVTADATSLAAGTYAGTIALTTNKGVVTPVTVTFIVETPGVPLTITPSELAFSYIPNGTVPPAQALTISGAPNFTAAASSTGNWLKVTPSSGAGNATLSVSVTPTGLATGSYDGTITITPTGAAPQTVPVTLTVSAGAISATPASLVFSYTINGTAASSQTISVVSTSGPVTFTAAASGGGWLTVTPASGTTPGTLTVSVNTSSLGPNSYFGSILITGGSGAPVSIPVTLTVLQAALPTIDRVVNAASYQPGSGLAPGEIVVVFGSGLGPATGVTGTVNSRGYFDTTLASVQVTFNGYAAPIIYAGAGQVNTIVPYELAGQSNASVEVIFGNARSNFVTLPVVSAAPGIFSADQSGTGGGAILNVAYQLVTSGNPAKAGDVIQIYATGQGQTLPAGVDGLIEPVTLPLPALTLAAGLTIGNLPANITYIGAAPGLVAGALQVNAEIPAGLPSGPAALVLSIGGYISQSGLTVAIQ